MFNIWFLFDTFVTHSIFLRLILSFSLSKIGFFYIFFSLDLDLISYFEYFQKEITFTSCGANFIGDFRILLASQCTLFIYLRLFCLIISTVCDLLNYESSSIIISNCLGHFYIRLNMNIFLRIFVIFHWASVVFLLFANFIYALFGILFTYVSSFLLFTMNMSQILAILNLGLEQFKIDLRINMILTFVLHRFYIWSTSSFLKNINYSYETRLTFI